MEINQEFSKEIDEIISAYNQAVPIEEGLEFSQKSTIKRILFYSLSEYLSNRNDKFGRRKPFKNVVNEHVDGEVAGTDPDFKQIQLLAENSKFVKSMLLRRELLHWAKTTGFSETLNSLNETYVRYGGVLAKKTSKNGQLFIDAVKWKDVITDQIDIDAGAIIERHWLSPTELRAKGAIWDNVEGAIELAQKYENGAMTTTNRTEVLEIEGEFPTSYWQEDAVDGGYERIKAFIAVKDSQKILLYVNKIPERTYKYKKRRPQLAENRALGIGVVEEGFETQISVNEVAIAENLAFQLGGKIIAKSNAANPNNLNFSSLETGSIINLEDNEYLEPLLLTPSTLPEYQRLTDSWEANYRRRTGVQDLTDDPKAGTAYSTVALQTKLSSGRTDYRRESFAFFVKELIQDWVLPFIIKKLEGSHILTSDFSPNELKMIDEAITNERMLPEIAQGIFAGKLIDPARVEQIKGNVQQDLSKFGATRSIDIPKGFFGKDFLKDITVLMDDEFFDRKAQNQTLFEMYKSMDPMDPNRAIVFQQLTEVGGAISPASLSTIPTAQPQAAGKPPAKTEEINSLVPQAQQ